MNAFISFGYNCEIGNVDIDLNEHRVRQHLKALIRGYGSSTEKIVIDFVNNTYSSIDNYGSVKEAWDILDSGQKNIVAGFRSLTSQPALDVNSPEFARQWFRNVVSDKYEQLRDEYQEDFDDLTIEIKAGLAKKAERFIRDSLTREDPATAWVIDHYSDND